MEGADTHRLAKELQSHGIPVVGSTIIGLENHTPTNIDEAIAYAVSHDTEFPEADIHGQYQFNFKHTHIPKGRETDYLLRNE